MKRFSKAVRRFKMNENRCIVMWRGIQYLVVRTSVPPTNNTLLILVPPTPENALEIITIMNPDKMEENECTFMPKYNKIAEQLLKMEVIKETEETLEGMPLSELLMNEDNTQLIPIYKINLNRVENVPELVKHFPQNLLKKYTECCKLKEDLNEIKYFSSDTTDKESNSFSQDDTNAESNSFSSDTTDTESNSFSSDTTDTESNSFSSDTTDTESNSFSSDTSNTESECNNSRELNPTLAWEVLAKKITKTQYGW
jgi:hypothetical protein